MREEHEIRALAEEYREMLAEAKARKNQALDAGQMEEADDAHRVVMEYLYVYNTLNWVLGEGWSNAT